MSKQINDAEKVLTHLEAKRAACIRQGTELQDERGANSTPVKRRRFISTAFSR